MFYKISINNKAVQLGQPLPEVITSCVIDVFPGVTIPSEQVPQLKVWLNQLHDKLACEYVQYNGVLMQPSDLNKFDL